MQQLASQYRTIVSGILAVLISFFAFQLGFNQNKFAHAETTSRTTQVIQNLAYGIRPAQKMDLYLPAKATHSPFLLIMLGGAWRVGDKASQFFAQNKVNHWVPKGYIAMSINYRVLPAANPLVQANNIAHVLAFVQSKASPWGGDSSHIVLLGHSAGVHLVSLLAASPGLVKQTRRKALARNHRAGHCRPGCVPYDATAPPHEFLR